MSVVVEPISTEYATHASASPRDGIRLLRQVHKVPFSDASAKNVTFFVAVHDESGDPRGQPTVMRIEAFWPKGGKVFNIRVGRSAIRSVGIAAGMPSILEEGFRHDVAVMLMESLMLERVNADGGESDSGQQHKDGMEENDIRCYLSLRM